MKKRIIVLSILLITIISIIVINNKIFKQENNKYTIETYIDGKLATSIPEANAGFKFKSATCSNGAIATFNHSTWRLKVKNSTSETICTIEFESNNNSNFNTYLKNKVCTDISSDDKTKDCLVQENGYRYEGEDPNNYVLFNDELWRIIGVFTITNSSGTTEDLVKLIRYNTLDVLMWNSSANNDWSNAVLQQTLNNSYLNATDATCYFGTDNTTNNNNKTCGFSKTGIKAGVRDKIENAVWNLGGASSASITTEVMYTAERGTEVYSGRLTTWTGHVGLMYPSDYGYATLASNCARTTNLGSYGKTACAGKNWLKNNSYEWTITPFSSSDYQVLEVVENGYINYFDVRGGYDVRPSIYLKSMVKYISGTGTYTDPYIIS